MAQLKKYKFTSNKNEEYVLVGTDYNVIIEKFKKDSPFFIGSIKSIDIDPVVGTYDCAVIDCSTSKLHLINIPSDFIAEDIEEHLQNLGFKLSQVSWGVFTETIDERINT